MTSLLEDTLTSPEWQAYLWVFLKMISHTITIAFILLCTSSIGLIAYNRYLHPLAKFPGPFFWTVTRLSYYLSMRSGWLHRDVLEMHRKYGPVVRIAPDELSFAREDVWQDIFTYQNGTPPFLKPGVWFSPRKGRALSLLNAIDPVDHARVRKALQPAFTDAGILRVEGTIRRYANLLISRLKEQCSNQSHTTPVNIVEWYNFTIFDIIGDLTFGESFQCLETGKSSGMALIIANSFRSATLHAMLKFFPGFGWLFRIFTPSTVTSEYEAHYKWVLRTLDKRLNLEQERPDIISLIDRDSNKDTDKGLAPDEVKANAQMLVAAGSETTVVFLCGITNFLVKNAECLQRLTAEIRTAFGNDEDITVTSLKGLPYFQAVWAEASRICNPTPVGVPLVVPPGGATVCGYALPEETLVAPHVTALGLLPQNFHDPLSFRPERWLPEAAQNPQSPYYNDVRGAVRLFGLGRRMCIGRSLAMAEIMLILAKMIWNFDIGEVDSPAGRLCWREDQRSFFVVEKRPFEIGLRLRARETIT